MTLVTEQETHQLMALAEGVQLTMMAATLAGQEEREELMETMVVSQVLTKVIQATTSTPMAAVGVQGVLEEMRVTLILLFPVETVVSVQNLHG